MDYVVVAKCFTCICKFVLTTSSEQTSLRHLFLEEMITGSLSKLDGLYIAYHYIPRIRIQEFLVPSPRHLGHIK